MVVLVALYVGTTSKSSFYDSSSLGYIRPTINFLVNDDIDCFKEYLDSDDMLDFPEREVFDTEDAALAFCASIVFGTDERAMPDRYPLRSCEPADAPFIEAIENY